MARYTGTMFRGKFHGLVTNEDADGKRFRGTFVDGAKTGDWVQLRESSVDTNPGATQGIYIKTYDGRTFVWNNYPKPGDQAAWSGSVDTEGYAKGQGQLDWYKNGKPVSSYAGEMVRGKWNGSVTNVDVDGKKYQGTFVNGVKASDWAEVAEFRRVLTAEDKELDAHWTAYLKQIQADDDYANWSGRPYDLYAQQP